MSFRLQSLVWKTAAVSGTTKLVALRLADLADDEGGSIYPAVPTIAADCGIGERTVQEALRTLERLGVVVLVSEANTDHRSRGYRIDVDALVTAPTVEHPRKSRTGAKSAPVQEPHPYPAESAPLRCEIRTLTPQISHPILPITYQEPTSDPASPAEGHQEARENGRYAFEGQVIRLNSRDLDRWRTTFTAIPDLTAELTSIDTWLADQPETKRRAWFHTVSGCLNRKHQEFLIKHPPPTAPRPRRQARDLSFDQEPPP